MPRFELAPVPEEQIIFDIPGAESPIEVPYLDCIEPAVLARVEKKMKANEVAPNDPEATRILLEEFCDTAEQKKTVNRLTLRQITQLQVTWNKESEASMGEFLDALESSTKKE